MCAVVEHLGLKCKKLSKKELKAREKIRRDSLTNSGRESPLPNQKAIAPAVNANCTFIVFVKDLA
jgi:hypothetical protein